MKLKYIGHFFGWILLCGNLLIALLLLLCAYSPYIDPTEHPVLANAGLAFPIFLLLNILYLIFWIIFYKRYTLLPIATLIICIPQIRTYMPLNTPSKNIPEDAIKILSYNVMAYSYDKPHKSDEPNEIINYLANSNADIICVQEAFLNKSKNSLYLNENTVEEAMANYAYHSHKQERGNGWDCFSRYPILSAKMIDHNSQGNGQREGVQRNGQRQLARHDDLGHKHHHADGQHQPGQHL